jgi:DNA-binding PadR family transcriptional regulator
MVQPPYNDISHSVVIELDVSIGGSMQEVERVSGSGALAYDLLAILWDGPRGRLDIARAFEERGVPPVYAAIDRQLRELEAGALIMARGAGAQRVYAIADRGSDMLAALAHDIGER